MSMTYLGIRPPALNVPLIELETTGGRLLDLYNQASLERVTLNPSQLVFDFGTTDSREVSVIFSGVRNLRVEQPEDWMPDESKQIDHLLIRPEGPWPNIMFLAGGLTFEFSAASLELVQQ